MEMELLNMESLDKYNANPDYYTAGYEYYSGIDARFLARPRVAVTPRVLVAAPTFIQVPRSTAVVSLSSPASLPSGNVNTLSSPASLPSGNINTLSSPVSLPSGNINILSSPASMPKQVSLNPSVLSATNTGTGLVQSTSTSNTGQPSMGFPMGGGGGGGGAMPPTEEGQQVPQEVGLSQGAVMKTKEPMSKNMKLGLGLLAVVGVYLIYKNKSKLFAK